jgi:hypothetical protein
MASGVCFTSPRSRLVESAPCKLQTCFWSAQSIAKKAENCGSGFSSGIQRITSFILCVFLSLFHRRLALLLEILIAESSLLDIRHHLSIRSKQSYIPWSENLAITIARWGRLFMTTGRLQPAILARQQIKDFRDFHSRAAATAVDIS